MSPMRSAATLLCALTLIFAAPACVVQPEPIGNPDPDPDPDPDPNPDPNPDPDPQPQPDPAGCSAPLTFADIGNVTGGNASSRPVDAANPAGPQWVTFSVGLVNEATPDAPRDVLFVSAWDGYGAFLNGLQPGTYPLTGMDANFYSCGACVGLAGDVDATTGVEEQLFVANGGTLTITAVDPTPGTGGFTGSLTNVTLAEVTLDDANQTQTAVASGCTTQVGSMSFDLGMQAGQ